MRSAGADSVSKLVLRNLDFTTTPVGIMPSGDASSVGNVVIYGTVWNGSEKNKDLKSEDFIHEGTITVNGTKQTYPQSKTDD